MITKSEVAYQFPVDTNFKAVCKKTDQERWERFLKILKLKGKARINLSATIHNNHHLSVDYHATFAAIKVKKT